MEGRPGFAFFSQGRELLCCFQTIASSLSVDVMFEKPAVFSRRFY